MELDEIKKPIFEGINAPNITALENTNKVLLNLNLQKFKFNVESSTAEGIAILFKVNDKYADIECLNDGDILFCIQNKNSDVEIWNVDQLDLDQSILKITSFLES